MTELTRDPAQDVNNIGFGALIGRSTDRIRSNIPLSIGVIMVGGMLLVALFAPWFARYDPAEQFRGFELAAPSASHWFGTDQLGRDLYSRVVYATRVAVGIGGLSVLLGVIIGGGSGLVSGYVGGRTDRVTMRMWDAVFALPALVLAIAFAATLGASQLVAVVALGIAAMPIFARVTRASVLAERNGEYVEAALSLGASTPRVIFRHILPNAMPPIVVQIAISVALAILLESGLSFLGLGVRPPTPSWGAMLNQSLLYARSAPWFGIFPGLALTVCVMGLNTLADGLNRSHEV